MITYRELDKIEDHSIPACAVALGNFDGVHKGHQKLIGNAVEYARKHGIKSVVFTFSNHPTTLIKDKADVQNILYPQEKARIIESLGVDYLIDIEFTHEIMKLEPEQFIYKLLLAKMDLKATFCGFNYSFGYMAKGTPDTLRELGKKYGFEVREMEAFKIDDEVVSSTLIRGLISGGKLKDVYKYQGRYYEIAGTIVMGNKIGRTIGFPTANIVIDEKMVTPPNGVYVTFCVIDGVKYRSITNVGVRPTIGDYAKNIETHIFDFNGNIYGKKIMVEFAAKTRDEVKFDSIEELRAQIARDCKEAINWHKQHTNAEF